jgi:hypothetical protein
VQINHLPQFSKKITGIPSQKHEATKAETFSIAINRSKETIKEHFLLRAHVSHSLLPLHKGKTLVTEAAGKFLHAKNLVCSPYFYVNAYKKSTNEVIIRDIIITKESVKKVWRRESYVNFRKVRENMAGRVPWCGNRP